jgi:PAS domain S-box-containing protein
MNGKSRTVLIVDDSAEDRELYRRYLLSDREYSYTILEAKLGRQGLDLWLQHQPDAILLDYRLPDGDGIEFLAQLQPPTQQPCLPVIMVTGQGNEAIAVKAIKAGAQDYLVKGQISQEGLQIAVNEAIAAVSLRAQLNQCIERERIVSDISQKIHQSLNLDEILQITVNEVREFLHTDRVLICCLKPDTSGTVLAESVGAEWQSLLPSSVYDSYATDSNSGLIGNYIEFYRQGNITAISDLQDSSIEPAYAEFLAQFQVKANLVVSIIYDDQFWGLLIAHNCAAPREWQPLEIDLLKELAIQVGIAIRQAELYQRVQNELADRKRVAEALHDSNERFRQLAENIDAVLWIKEVANNRISYVSPAYERLWGLKSQELYKSQQVWVNLIHPEDRQATDTAFQEKAAAGLFDQEYRIILPDGRTRWVRDRCFPLRDETGKIYRFAGIAEDISDRTQAEQALRENEQLLRLALAGAHAGSWDWNLQTNKVAWSSENCDLYGLTATNNLLEYEDWYNALHPDDRERAITDVTAVIEERLSEFRSEFRIIHPQQGVRWLLGLGRLTFNQQGQAIRLSGINIDITDYKQVQESLRQSEELKLRVLDNSSDCIKLLNLGGELSYMNRGGTVLLEIEDPSPYLNLDWTSFWEGDDRTAAKTAIARAKAGKRSRFQGFTPTAKGTPKWWDIAVTPILDAAGRTAQILVISRDITEHKQAEKALRESGERFRTLADNISQLAWMADGNGWLFWYNQRWFDYTGTTLEEMQGWGWQAVHHPDHLERVVKYFSDCLETGELWEDTFPLRGQDGEYRWFLSRAIPIRDQQGKVLRWFGTNTDITERQQAAQERDRLLELERIARADAERSNRIKDEFLAVLSHELRSPLNPILGWTQLLQTHKLNATQTAEALATIERNAKLQTQLIDDLLDVAKILRGKLTIDAIPVNLIFVIESALDTVRTAALAKSIVLHPILPNIGQVSGDPNRLQQIVWNLLSNAIKFTAQGGQVEIYLKRVDTKAEITVSDTGKGINPEFLPYIFESFRQEDISITRKYGGLGLGLAIVRQLVEAHGGTIKADSPGEGLGATFKVLLPLLNIEPEIKPIDELPQQALNLTGIRVLTVDDDADSRELLTLLLTQYGAEVLTVESAAQVLTEIDSFRPDVLVSDIGMPEVDGYSLIRQIRALTPEQGGQIPAIALTAYARVDDHQRSITSGYQRHLTKPLNLEQLVKAVLELAEGKTDMTPES